MYSRGKEQIWKKPGFPLWAHLSLFLLLFQSQALTPNMPENRHSTKKTYSSCWRKALNSGVTSKKVDKKQEGKVLPSKYVEKTQNRNNYFMKTTMLSSIMHKALT